MRLVRDDTPAQVQAAMSAATVDPSTYPIASPWSSSDLQRIVFEDIYGSDIPANTRSAAMSLPAVARARNLLVATVSRTPLTAFKGADELPDDEQPGWTYRTDTATPPQLRLAWTVDDLIFYGWSCWSRVNGADGFPLHFTRVDQGSWEIDADNRVLVNGVPQRPEDVTLIPGLHEGILGYGRDAIRDARALYRTVRQRLKNPVPNLELHQTGGDPLNDAQVDDLIESWAAARSGDNGGVAFTNQSIEVIEHGAAAEQLMIEARNAASLDLARMVGVAASRIDATAPKSSLNYETTVGRNIEFVDFDLALYMTPITARLSMDDVMPRGHRVAFDLTDLTGTSPGPTGPELKD